MQQSIVEVHKAAKIRGTSALTHLEPKCELLKFIYLFIAYWQTEGAE